MPKMILSTGLASELKGRLNLQGMTKSTLKPAWTTAWESRITGIFEHRLWGLSLRVLPWIGLAFLFWQARQRFADLSTYPWDSGLWMNIWQLSAGDILVLCLILLMGIPALSLWVDSLKWVILMHPSLTFIAAMKMAWRQWPLVGYGMLGSMAVPGRLSEFAGRCRFYPLEQHPRVMASTLMASATQWVWVLAVPACWILGFATLSSDLVAGKMSLAANLSGLPVEFRMGLSNPVWGGVLMALAAAAVTAWWRIYRRLQVHDWSTASFIQVFFWSLIRYGLLILQWALWLSFAELSVEPWMLMGVISAMLVLQWFVPLGFFLDLGFKGALSFWIWGNALAHPADALGIPLMIWISNLVIPALIGGMWWWRTGQKFKVL